MNEEFNTIINIFGKDIAKSIKKESIKQSALAMIKRSVETIDEIVKKNKAVLDNEDSINLLIILANAEIFDNDDAEALDVKDIKTFRNCVFKAKEILSNAALYQIKRLDNIIADKPVHENKDNLESMSKEELIALIKKQANK